MKPTAGRFEAELDIRGDSLAWPATERSIGGIADSSPGGAASVAA